MKKGGQEIWKDGFSMAQETSEAACPYQKKSREAEAWLDGWYQGTLKREGLNYRKGPVEHNIEFPQKDSQ